MEQAPEGHCVSAMPGRPPGLVTTHGRAQFPASYLISKFLLGFLTPDIAPFLEGFVVIQSPASLDVTGVYAVPGGIDVERVPERVRARE